MRPGHFWFGSPGNHCCTAGQGLMADDVRWGTAATQVDGLLRDADEGWSGCGHTDKVVGSQVAVVPGCWMGERRPFWPLAFGWSIRVTLLFRHKPILWYNTYWINSPVCRPGRGKKELFNATSTPLGGPRHRRTQGDYWPRDRRWSSRGVSPKPVINSLDLFPRRPIRGIELST